MVVLMVVLMVMVMAMVMLVVVLQSNWASSLLPGFVSATARVMYKRGE